MAGCGDIAPYTPGMTEGWGIFSGLFRNDGESQPGAGALWTRMLVQLFAALALYGLSMALLVRSSLG